MKRFWTTLCVIIEPRRKNDASCTWQTQRDGDIVPRVKRCHICGKPASIFLTQIVGSKARDLALCEECARKRGIFDPRKLGEAGQFIPKELEGEIEQFLRSMISGALPHVEEQDEDEEELAEVDSLEECPSCHYKLTDFQQSGLLGCPDCYKAFAGEFEYDTDEAYDADEPEKADSEPSIAEQKEYLEEMLKHAIRLEHYEEAAKLRDQIKSLTS